MEDAFQACNGTEGRELNGTKQWINFGKQTRVNSRECRRNPAKLEELSF
jgi:hypothetical protein